MKYYEVQIDERIAGYTKGDDDLIAFNHVIDRFDGHTPDNYMLSEIEPSKKLVRQLSKRDFVDYE